MAKKTEYSIPNVLWSYWESPDPILPPIVELCHKSWLSVGEFDEVNFLRPEDVELYLDPTDLPVRFSELPPVKKADAVRLALLAKSGGFWVDAGVLVTGPVHSWTNQRASTLGFFVFQDVDKSRVLDTWFIGGTIHSKFLKEWHLRHNRFFGRRKMHETHSLFKTPSRIATHALVAINKTLGRSVTRRAAWARFPLSRLPMYPYFIMHYIANSMLRSELLQAEFDSMSKVKASLALSLRSLIDRQELTPSRATSAMQSVPIHKLNTYRDYSAEELRTLRGLLPQLSS